MKIHAKLRSVIRQTQWWVQGKIARASVGQHLPSAYIHAMPTSQPGPAGVERIARLSARILQAVPVSLLFLDHEHAAKKGVLASADLGDVKVHALTGIDQPNSGHAALSGEHAAIWIDEYTPPEQLEVLEPLLGSCAFAYIGVAPGSGASVVHFIDLMMRLGFEPVARDAQQHDGNYHMLFLHASALKGDSLAGLPYWVQKAVAPQSVPKGNGVRVPVLVPCFNNQTYCRAMISQLRACGLDDITLLDNASTSEDMQRFLGEAEKTVRVMRLGENLGPKDCLFAPGVFDELPRYFCVTDPDIVFNPFLPNDFLEQLISLTREYRVGKVGFALDISHRQFFRDLRLKLLYQDWKVWEWEERFWAAPIGTTTGNDKIFKADIDTTFALYDKQQWSREDFTTALRVAGRFTATHAPWYEQSSVSEDEQENYRQGEKFSYYKM